MSDLILTKVAPPRWMGNQIRRDALLERLDLARHRRLTLIYAPAGYGKTSLLSQWRSRYADSTRIAWLTLERDETDLRRLSGYIMLALDDAPEADDARTAALPPRAAASAIINRLEREIGPVVLILDDFHRAQSREVDDFVCTLIALAPANCHFVISSRDYPRLGQTVLAAEEQLLEITAEDLKFSAVEAEALLTRTLGDAAPDWTEGSELRQIVERTEGWPIALQLAALSLRRGADHRQLVGKVHGGAFELGRYLSEQVLMTMSEDTQEVVMRTALLDRLTGELVNLLCDRDDGWFLLEKLEEQGVFLTALDGTREVYRYHQLFAEYLRERMARRDRAGFAALHRRLAQYFAQSGEIAEAISHAMQGDDVELLAAIMEDAGGWRLIPQGKQALVARGLARLPRTLVDSRPRLALARVYLEIKRGELGKARADFDAFAAGLNEAELSADQWTEMRVVGDILTDYENRPCTLDDLLAREALLRTLPSSDHLVLANVNEELAARYYEGGWLERALEPTRAAREHYRALGSLYSEVFTRFWEARIRRAQGRCKDAVDILSHVRAEIEENFGPRSDLAANCAAFEAELLYEQDQVAASLDRLGWAVEHMEQSDAWVDVCSAAYFTAARALTAQGRADEAQAMILRARRLAQNRRFRQLELLSDLCELELLIDAGGDPAVALGMAARIDLDMLTQSEADGQPLYRPVITAALLCRSKLALIAGEFGAALVDLRGLGHWAIQHGAGRLHIEVNLLLAHALRRTGEVAEARACFDNAVGTAMFQGIVRPFIDRARFIEPMLGEALGGSVQPDRFRAQFLRGIARTLAARSAAAVSPDMLSEAETEILQHLSFGYSNKEIARLIGMSPDTVKYRLKSAFRKIGVHKRRDAVRVVSERGLLAEAVRADIPA